LKYYEHYLKKSRTFLENEERKYGFPVLYISEDMANKALSKHKKGLTIESWKEKMRNTGTPEGIVIKTNVELNIQKEIKKITGENVLGYIEGTDLKDELVVITAHYDHLGISDGEIYYGADDDGSGTVSLMEIAEAFMVAKKEGKGPRRSVLIMPVSGEEKGLLGSDYYTQNPVFPLKNTVVDLNIDMIGRLDENHLNDPDYVYIIGSDKLSGELFELSEEVNKKYINIKYDYTYNDDSDPNRFYYRSDHYNFAKNNIPVIFYFTGVHEDYHKPTDTVDKIDYQKTERIARLVFLTAWEIANRTKRLEVDRIPK
jgi:Zn-dependent M28 family amino/carboxypeptidase